MAENFKVTVNGGGLAMDQKVDQATALRVVNLLMGGGLPAGPDPEDDDAGDGGDSAKRKARAAKRSGAKSKGPAKKASPKRARKTSVGVLKDLSLRPKGKTSFKDFAEEKKPTSNHAKSAVCVYWLALEAGEKASPEAVNTCYAHVGWKRPSELRNALRLTASKKGWIDTADSEDIKITTSGEDFVRHDLPASSEK
jgi:hypothetical protein